MSPRTARARRGQYLLTVCATVGTLLALGGLAIDVGWVLRARAEAQAVADDAARAAVIALRRTGDTTLATEAAERVAALNHVAGEPPTVLSIAFGSWDDTAAAPSLDTGALVPNAAQVTVGRVGDDALPAWLSRLVGATGYGVQARATAATRSVHLAIALDGAPDQAEADFLDAKDALQALLVRLTNAPAPADAVALTLYDSRFAWLISPLTSPATDAAGLTASWAALAPASRAGDDASPSDGIDCAWHTDASIDDFTTPAGGCYPSMPRAYADETGSDPAAGLRQLEGVLQASTDAPSVRALIVLTRHLPTATPADAGDARTADGYAEVRFAGHATAAGRTEADIRADALDATGDLWAAQGVHAWSVALGVDDPFLSDLVQGDGWSVTTSDPTTIPAQLARIADALPVALVE